MQQGSPLCAPYLGFGVSILYEANEVCNGLRDPHLLRARLVSILYEANEVCNLMAGLGASGGTAVSILYEANEVCNGRRDFWS